MSEKLHQDELNFKESPATSMPEKVEPAFDCSYCEDVGACSYCDRGKEYAKQYKDLDIWNKIKKAGKKPKRAA